MTRKDGPVLVLTNPQDVTADAVVEALDDLRVDVFRCDTADFPTSLTMAAQLEDGWAGIVESKLRSLDLARVRSAYYRRPEEFKPRGGLSPAARAFTVSEARCGFLGVLAALDCRWVNHPSKDAAANYKPLQLRIACAAGLRPPRTIITNDPESARAFAHHVRGPVIYKALGPGVVDDDGVAKGAPTAIVDPVDFDESIRLTAHLLQEYVQPKCHEIRLTVVGPHLFAAEIHARSPEARID